MTSARFIAVTLEQRFIVNLWKHLENANASKVSLLKRNF